MMFSQVLFVYIKMLLAFLHLYCLKKGNIFSLSFVCYPGWYQKAQTVPTCQSVIHIKTKTLDLLHGQASVDKYSGEWEQCTVIQCFNAWTSYNTLHNDSNSRHISQMDISTVMFFKFKSELELHEEKQNKTKSRETILSVVTEQHFLSWRSGC